VSVTQPIDAHNFRGDEDILRRLLEPTDAFTEEAEAFRGNLDDALGFDRGGGFQGRELTGTFLLLPFEEALLAGLEGARSAAFSAAFSAFAIPVLIGKVVFVEILFVIAVARRLLGGAFAPFILKFAIAFVAAALAMIALPSTTLLALSLAGLAMP
jgi:hypothetical protein